MVFIDNTIFKLVVGKDQQVLYYKGTMRFRSLEVAAVFSRSSTLLDSTRFFSLIRRRPQREIQRNEQHQ